MASASVAYIAYTRYLTSGPNRFLAKGNSVYNLLDDGFFKLGQHIGGLGREVAQLRGDTESAKNFGKVEGVFDTARSAIQASRFLFAVPRFFTGQMFFDEGFRRVKHEPIEETDESGQKFTTRVPITIQGDGSWEKGEDGLWRNKLQPELYSVDGKYIDDPFKGEFVKGKGGWKNALMNIAMAIMIIFNRILRPIGFLHNQDVYNLGKHAATAIRGTSAALWGAILSINMFQCFYDLIDEVNGDFIKEKAWSAFQGSIDLIALIFDFGVGSGSESPKISGNPTVAIIGSVFNIGSALSLLAKEAYDLSQP